MKLCTKCQERKPDDKFRRLLSGRLDSWCKTCKVRVAQASAARRKEQRQEYLHRRHVDWAYGMTPEQYANEIAKGCSICPAPAECIDHNHKTNQVRGPLCQTCNKRVGVVERTGRAKSFDPAPYLAYLENHHGHA